MKQLNFLFLALLAFIACSKEKKIERRIDGGQWNAVSYTTGSWDAAGQWQQTVETFTGTVVFNKDNTCEWFGEKGFYHAIGPGGRDNIEGFLDIDLPSDYKHMTVLKCSRRELIVSDDGNLQSAYGTGYAVEYKFEKD